jgi:hypothetical protein
VMDMAKIIGYQREGADRSVGASCGPERSVRWHLPVSELLVGMDGWMGWQCWAVV